MEPSLLKLPKDVLKFILSIVLVNTYITLRCGKLECTKNIIDEWLTKRVFHRKYHLSQFSPHVKTLAMVHPLFRDILRNATLVENSVWGFCPQLFATLRAAQET